MIKVDLHTHSIISPDGGITAEQYEELLDKKKLDCLAITDHNETKFAKMLHNKLGDKIIIGEEITTQNGEMIGLFLKQTIPAGLSAKQTALEIRQQEGLVYIPHPFETMRLGMQRDVLEKIIDCVDIIEVFNGRGRWRGKAKEAENFAKAYHLSPAASSDAHGIKGTGKTMSIIEKMPERDTLKKLLEKGSPQKNYAPLWTFLCPSVNRIKNKFVLGV